MPRINTEIDSNHFRLQKRTSFGVSKCEMYNHIPSNPKPITRDKVKKLSIITTETVYM